MPTFENRQREFFNLLIPKLNDPSSDVQWFLAEQLGKIMAVNPDFRTETLLSMVPKSFQNPLEEMFWLPSAGWMLTSRCSVTRRGPVGSPPQPQRAASLRAGFVRQESCPRSRWPFGTVAISMLYQPALYSSPEVVAAASRIDTGNFRRLLPDAFEREIRKAAQDDSSEQKLELDTEREKLCLLPRLCDAGAGIGESRGRQFVLPCHGGGKIPSMPLEAPDRRTKYLSPQATWTNYRTLLDRINQRFRE